MFCIEIKNMRNIFTFLSLFFSYIVLAQINFENETVLLDESHYSQDITSIILVDLDNDNYKDLVVASSDDIIMWYKNVNGDFSYYQRKILSISVDIPSSIVSGDLNNDGLQDIIATSSSAQDKIVWFQNLGNGNFSNEIIISNTINGPLAANVIDIDNDGDMDILTGGYDDTVIFFENNGNGTFQTPVTIYDGYYDTRKIKTADLDNDGLLDIISGHNDGGLYWSKNLGNNNFGNRQYITGSSDDGTAIGFIDVNEDGFLDIVTANNYSSDNVRYILNQGGMSFDNNNAVVIDSTIEEPYEIQTKDIDNDGKKDIIVSFWANDNVSWYKNLGDSNFSNKKLITNNVRNPKSFFVEDINNDGNYDIISSASAAHNETTYLFKLSVFKNEMDASSFEETIVNYWYGYPRDIKIADINNDDNNDIVIAGDDLIWYKNYGNALLSSYKLISTNNINEKFLDLEILDLDSDGNKDIVALKEVGVEVFINQGDETFISLLIPYVGLKGNIKLSDIDGDSLKDIIVVIDDDDDNKIGWIRNEGNNTFGDVTIFSENLSFFKPHKIDVGDIDNDGDNDILVGSKYYSSILLLINDGMGNLAYTPIAQSLAIDEISLKDVDNDGYLDIVSGGNLNLSWIKNNNGVFASTRTNISSNTGATEFSFLDIDNNGFEDLFCVVNEYYDDTLGQTMFYFLNGLSGFGEKVAIGSIQEYANDERDIYIKDVNGDKKPDIVTSYRLQKKAHLLLNRTTLSIVDESLDNLTIKLYPVPFTNKLHWNDLDGSEFLQAKIFDISGKEVLLKTNFTGNEIDLNLLPSGIYIINFETTDNKVISRKIIKD